MPREKTREAAIEVVIDRIGRRGDGIAHAAGGRVFVPYTLPGERARVAIDRRTREGAFARIVELGAPSPERIAPACPHFGRCGGCALQHWDRARYAAWKRECLIAALSRHGLASDPVEELRRTDPGRRRRADLAAWRSRRGAVVLGFHERRRHRLVDIAACPVLEPALVRLLGPLRDVLASLMAPGGRAGVKMHLAPSGMDVLIELDRPPDLAGRQVLAEFADANDLARLAIAAKVDGVIEPIAVRRRALVRFGSVEVEPPPGAFGQATEAAERLMVEQIRAAFAGARRIVDLYSGCGALSFPLAAGAAVHAVDVDGDAIAALVQAARRAGLGRVTGEVRDLDRQPYQPDELDQFEAALFDPPRAGARAQAEAIARSGLTLVAAVSCNPATFARDARILVDHGFTMTRAIPIDQFLWSPHLEVVALFRR